jgi:hypothetical protein
MNDFKLVKLINGEDIICSIEKGKDNSIQVNSPLKLQVFPKFSGDHIAESLNLSHWVHPYTETKTFNIPNSSVLLIADVSPGLSKYYEYILRKIEINEDVLLDEDIDNDDIYDELLESMDTDSDSIH